MNPEDDDEFSARLREQATRHRASPALRASVRTQIALQAAARPAAQRWPGAFGWRSAAVGLVCGVLLGTALGPWVQGQLGAATLESELVADHVRALGAGPLIQVASSDRHTVKPWFQGRLDYAPPVPDLAVEGFPLLGGRVQGLRGRNVAALVYGRDLHRLNVYVWPADRVQPLQTSVLRGFHVAQWSDGAMQVWVVSDVEAGEVARFATAWRARLQ